MDEGWTGQIGGWIDLVHFHKLLLTILQDEVIQNNLALQIQITIQKYFKLFFLSRVGNVWTHEYIVINDMDIRYTEPWVQFSVCYAHENFSL